MGKSKEERLAEVHERALTRFDRCYASQREQRLLCVQDRRFVFVNGAQFEGDIGQQFLNRPRFEINKVHQSVIRIFSEYRNNRVTVDFRPADLDTTEETAEFLDGRYRADEQESGAQEAYDNAFEEGVAGGMGAWRLVNRERNEEDEDRDARIISIEPIPDADNSVFFDIDAKKYDKRDATYGFVISSMQPSEYSDQTGNDGITEAQFFKDKNGKGKTITSFDRTSRMTIYDWFSPDVIYIAEYFEVEMITTPVNFYEHPLSGETEKVKGKENIEMVEQELFDQGFQLTRTKKVKARKVHKYLIDGNRVLEDQGYIAGKNIPLVPFYAKRLFVDNIERIMGHIRLATDAQRLYNMLISMLAELTTYSWVEKPVVTPEQIQGHAEMWALDPVKRYPYLLLNPVTDAATGQTQIPALQYTKVPNLPPALTALLQLIGVDIQEVLGQSNNAQEVVSNISAKAVELIQTRLDMQNFIYMDNFKKSMKRCGEIWLDMERELADEDEKFKRIVKEDGTDEVVELRKPVTGKNGEVRYLNDPNAGDVKVVADVGPSFTTRRDGTVRAITGMMQFMQDPQDQAVLSSIAMNNLEGEGLTPARKYFRGKLIALGLEDPTPEEAEEIQKAQASQKPDPQAQFLMAEAEKALALAKKAQADTLKALADAEKINAQVAQIASSMKTEDLDRILKLLEAQRGEEPATTS